MITEGSKVKVLPVDRVVNIYHGLHGRVKMIREDIDGPVAIVDFSGREFEKAREAAKDPGSRVVAPLDSKHIPLGALEEVPEPDEFKKRHQEIMEAIANRPWLVADMLVAWEQELSKVMPADYKDWWENNKAEWPIVARLTIESLTKREEQAWKMMANSSPESSRSLVGSCTGIEAEVCEDIARRQRTGMAKYGMTVADNPLSLIQWLNHAYEECLDQAIYLKRAIKDLAKQIKEKSDEDKPATEEDSFTEADYQWRKSNLSSGFNSWQEEIDHAKSQGYRLAPPDYVIPHWSSLMSAEGQARQLYVMRDSGQLEEFKLSSGRLVSEIAYPLFLQIKQQQGTKGSQKDGGQDPA